MNNKISIIIEFDAHTGQPSHIFFNAQTDAQQRNLENFLQEGIIAKQLSYEKKVNKQ